ncbi:hypothetical protein R50073_40860 [Maricurvus nonylphenolicus]|uniref:hypothetical protein n=1 Tax=Maricurvus nonylphenolicus TaxID=1008307 RepID=UPI0036F35BBD
MTLSKSNILLIGLAATIAGLLGAAADVYSVWTGKHTMDTAFAVGLDNVMHIMLDKSIEEMVIGNYLAQFFIPIHGCLGAVLTYTLFSPFSRKLSITLAAAFIYGGAIGAGYHSTILPYGALVNTGNTELINMTKGYWDFVAYSMVTSALVITALITILLIKSRAFVSMNLLWVSPLGTMSIFTILFYVLPDGGVYRDAKEFMTIAGFNFPLAIFYLTLTLFILSNYDQLKALTNDKSE